LRKGKRKDKRDEKREKEKKKRKRNDQSEEEDEGIREVDEAATFHGSPPVLFEEL